MVRFVIFLYCELECLRDHAALGRIEMMEVEEVDDVWEWLKVPRGIRRLWERRKVGKTRDQRPRRISNTRINHRQRDEAYAKPKTDIKQATPQILSDKASSYPLYHRHCAARHYDPSLRLS